jgi:hypothetical protein
MTGLDAPPAIVDSAQVAPKADPFTCLLAAALSALPRPRPEGTGLLVATDGSRLGRRRIFRQAAKPAGKLPPRLVPYRLSNGPASRLAIDFGYTGRVVTLPCGGWSLLRALRLAASSLEAGVGPAAWDVVAGLGEALDGTTVRGAAVALRIVGGPGRRLLEISTSSAAGIERRSGEMGSALEALRRVATGGPAVELQEDAPAPSAIVLRTARP